MNQISSWLGKKTSILVLCISLVMFVTVILRYFFQTGWVWMQDLVIYMNAIVVFVGATVALSRDAHIRVDIFYREKTPRQQALRNMMGVILFLLPTCGLIFWTSFEFVKDSWSILEGARDVGGLPLVFLLKTCIPLLALGLLLQGMSLLKDSFKIWRSPDV